MISTEKKGGPTEARLIVCEIVTTRAYRYRLSQFVMSNRMVQLGQFAMRPSSLDKYVGRLEIMKYINQPSEQGENWYEY